MNWPVVVWIGLQVFALGVCAANHGRDRKPMNFWGALLGASISNSVLYWGGWFS